jgi:tRNA 2-selenouridine synthase
MQVHSIDITDLLKVSRSQPLFDVRSPSEFRHAHIPGSINIPLFTDEERAVIGTLYKQKGRQEAVLRGLDFFGPKMKSLIHQVDSAINIQEIGSLPESPMVLHCWRGGMRSASVAWLMNLYGFQVSTLHGGYKNFRKWVIDYLTQPFAFKILGGYTGSLKTRILRCMREKTLSRVLDLEDLASHRGSAFGGYGLPEQPSQEMFENLVAYEIHRQLSSEGEINQTKGHSAIWIEDESQRIGRVNIPIALWNHMRTRPVYFLDLPFQERLENIIMEYGRIERDLLIGSIDRISKRLGGLEANTCRNLLMEGDIRGAFSILLKYYDKTYDKALKNRPESKEIIRISISGKSAEEVADMLLNI